MRLRSIVRTMGDRPKASSPAVSARMSRQARTGTAPELQLRKELHRRGLRFRVATRALPQLRSLADIVFRPTKVAVYVDGCFWHSCPIHATSPASNAAWWREKLDRNVARDRATDAALTGAGWTVVRVWEHEDPVEVAERIEALVRARRARRI
jgi:DNA mismatch endonuclease (patch repair protein)